MAVPSFQSITKPALELCADGRERSSRQLREELIAALQLSEDDLAELLPSGSQRTFDNRTHWAIWYLQKAGLLERVRRGVFRITERGRAALAAQPPRIDVQFLMQYPEIRELRAGADVDTPTSDLGPANGALTEAEPPDAVLARAYALHRRAVEEDLLAQLRRVTPTRFESIVIEVLVAMGYGGSFAEAAERIGRSGDGGIDGIIKEDRLGLDVVCVQAKRWADTVGRPVVQAFAGSLQGVRARKGVIITTSRFSPEAIDFAERIDARMVLIDGPTLARFMFDHEVGASTLKGQVYAVKRIDEDFFEDD